MVESLLCLDVARIAKRGFPTYTDVQKQAIPLIAQRKNVLVIAPTGSGKTETALLPILSGIVQDMQKARQEQRELQGIRAIYITPLRALNRDLFNRFQKWCDELKISVAVRHGDTPQSERTKQRDKPPLFLITTPETLQSVLIAPKLSDALVNVKHVVVDEVHELFESKRGVQLALGLQRLEGKAPGFQRIGLSATIGSPEQVAAFIGKNTEICNAVKKRNFNLSVEYVTRGRGAEAARLKAQLHMPSAMISRMQRIEEVIHQHKSALIFVNTRYAAESISNALYAIESLKHDVSVHHSSLSKEVRIETEKKFKEQQVKAIVCTSSLELGIDIGTIEIVVQYGSPRQTTRLVQRIGRSGHRHYLEPKGIILPTDPLDLAESVVLCQQALQGNLEKPGHHFNALDVLAHFVAGICIEYGKIQLTRIAEMARQTYSYKDLTDNQVKSVCIQLKNNKIINLTEENGETFAETRGTRTRLYYYENISTIPDEKKYFVRDSTTRKNVAVLDEAFVSELEAGGIFIARGKAWKILSITGQELVVEATGDITAAIPDWVGEEIPVTMQTAQSVADALNARHSFPLSKHEEETLVEYADRQGKFFAPGRDIVVEENVDENIVVIHSFNGLRGNETLARVLSLLLSQRDKSLKTRASPYSVVMEFSRPVSGQEVASVLQKLLPKTVETVLTSALPSTKIFRHKFIHVGKRFGFISRKWEASIASMGRIVNTLAPDNPMIQETTAELMRSRLSLEDACTVARLIQEKKIEVRHAYSNTWSPLAKSALELGGLTELVIPPAPTQEVLNAFAATLREKRVRIYCTFCKNDFSVMLSEVEPDQKVKCGHCGSSQVTLAEYVEKDQPKEAAKATALISSYGGKALYALETYGIGPQTAGRVLAKSFKNNDDFFAELLETQKSFVKNRKYWKI